MGDRTYQPFDIDRNWWREYTITYQGNTIGRMDYDDLRILRDLLSEELGEGDD